MDQKAIDLHGQYIHGLLDRREFLRRLAILAGRTAAANALLLSLENNVANAQVVPKDDPRIQAEHMKYPGATGEIRAYLARPRGDGKLPGVIVIQEIYGLVPHIEDVARRIALEGFSHCSRRVVAPWGNPGRSE